jgi:multidrug efflux pump
VRRRAGVRSSLAVPWRGAGCKHRCEHRRVGPGIHIGLIVLVGLAAKNAILIVEFARELEFAGRLPVQAAVEASRLRLRPILMTSLAFVMGVLPLVASFGAGAEMRRAMGVAVFAGMLGVTAFGIFLTPVFYVLLRRLTGNRPLASHHAAVPLRGDVAGAPAAPAISAREPVA